MAHQQEVIVTTKNTTALTLGIISLVLGVLALLVGWIPFLGLIAIPVAAIGGLLALFGFFASIATAFRGVAMPLVGGTICAAAIALPIFMTGTSSVAISEAANEVTRELEAQQTQRELEQDQRDLEEDREAELAEAEKNAYLSGSIALYDFEASYHESMFDGTIPGVTFKLKNNGDRTLSRVEVTVYFQDGLGNTIAEEDYHPVLVSEYSFSTDNKPLKPGYVWQQESGKFYSAKTVPSEWKEGAAYAEITEITFAN